MRIAVLQHLQEEGPGHIAAWAAQRGHRLAVFRADLGQLPDLADIDAMIVLGGPYCVFAEAVPAWMAAEKRLLQQVLGQASTQARVQATMQPRMPLLGICMGAQLIAQQLGAELGKMAAPELGWQEIQLLAPPFQQGGALSVLQWHEDAFSLPPGARHLAGSAHWPVQAFLWGHSADGLTHGPVLGLQFHAEWDAAIVETLRRRFGAEAPFAAPAAADAPRYAAACEWLLPTLDAWIESRRP